jgi:uncharacterized protein YvpB
MESELSAPPVPERPDTPLNRQENAVAIGTILKSPASRNQAFFTPKLFIVSFIAVVVIGVLLGVFMSLLSRSDFRWEDVTNTLISLDFDMYFLLITILYSSAVLLTAFYFVSKKLQFKRIPSFKKIFIPLAAALFVATALLVYKHQKIDPSYSYTFPSNGESLVDYSRPIEVKFTLPVETALLKPSIVPEIKGQWVWDSYNGIPNLTRTGRFIIEQTPFPEERFILYIAGISKSFDDKEHEHGFEFFAPAIPEIVQTNLDDVSMPTARDTSFNIQFNKDYEQLIGIQARLEPFVNLSIGNKEENSIEFKPEQLLQQGTEYKLTLNLSPKSVDIAKSENLAISNTVITKEYIFTTASEPLIESFLPQGDQVRENDKVQLVFKDSMNKQSVESRLAIEPSVEGTLAWLDDRTITYEPVQPLPKDTLYKFTLASGATNIYGGILEKNLEFQFKTLGKVGLNSISPQYNSGYVSEFAEIVIEFNQEVDQNSAQTLFSIAPAHPGNIRWEGNKMIFTPSSPFALGSTYYINVGAGIKSLYGLDGETSYVSPFSTRPNIYSFDIPMYFQQTSFSCNIYTAMMVLAWKGIGSNATSLISEIGYNDGRNGDSWSGNPYREYVGNSDGSWGYGVYWPPIQNILSARGVSSDVRQNWNISELAKTVQQGNPVIVWRYNGVGGGQNISWTAADGSYVYAFNGMHGSVVTGFQGNPDNPTSIYIHDPWLGKLWLSASAFDSYWSFSGRTALVVY